MNCFSTYGVGGYSVWENSMVINDTNKVFDYFNVDSWNNSLSCCRDPQVFPTTNVVENVKVRDNLLLLDVIPLNNNNTKSSSISSKEDDFLYGSFRFEAKVPDIPGTASGFFYFHSITEEIDMEFLSHENFIRLAIQPILRNITTNEASSLSQSRITNPGKQEFKEYRFDWYETRVDFYINSVYYNTLSYNVPKLPGKIIINHRSNGNPKWSRGPPNGTSTLIVKKISFYYNTSTTPDNCNKVTVVDSKKGFDFKKYGTIVIVGSILGLIGLAGLVVFLLPSAKPKIEEIVKNPEIIEGVQTVIENPSDTIEVVEKITENRFIQDKIDEYPKGVKDQINAIVKAFELRKQQMKQT